MNSKITYHQQVSYCGKPRCRRCQEGTGHGPYWYGYQTINGKTTRTYIGKELPPDILATIIKPQEPTSYERDQEKATIRIYALGQFRLERRDGSNWIPINDASWQHQRVRSVLCCLVSSAARRLAREQIMDMLWPELDATAASARLDRAVHSLRQVFEPSRSRLATSPLLLTERELVALADQGQIWIDVEAFEKLIAQARASKDPGEVEKLLDEAVNLYSGDFLPEVREMEMTLMRRDGLRHSWIGIMIELIDLRIARDDTSGAIELLNRLLAADQTNEAAAQRLMCLLAQKGRRGEAMQVYKRLSMVLEQAYHIEPLPETQSIYEAVRQGIDKLTGKHKIQFSGPMRRPEVGDTPLIQIGRPQQNPLVGRKQELEALYNMLTKTERDAKFRLPTQKRAFYMPVDSQRTPQSVLIMGDVGIGKTRMAEEMAREAKRRGWSVAWSRIYTQEGIIPFRLWVDILRSAFSQGTWQRQEVSKHPLTYAPLIHLLPELQDLIPLVEFPPLQAPEQEQLRIWEATRDLLTTISTGTPLLIVMDDLQWSDASSCELFAYLARRIYGHAITIVGTLREKELPPDHVLHALLTDLYREHAVATIQLEPLTDDQIATLVGQMLSSMEVEEELGRQPVEQIMQFIKKRVAGNPFFAEELARVSPAAVAAMPANGRDYDTLIAQLPETITAVLGLRLSRLSAGCQRLLGKAAVLGDAFSFEVICAMEEGTPGSNEDIVLELLEEGLRSGMLAEAGAGVEVSYSFWHPVLVRYLYENLSAARRRFLHGRAAEILRRIYEGREEEVAAAITHHLIRGGGTPDLIVRYAEMAANHAYKLSSYPEAERHYAILLRYLPDTPAEHLRRAYLIECLGECARVQGKFEESRAHYEQALAMRQQYYSTHTSPDPLYEAQIQAILRCEIGTTWYNLGELARAQECFGQVMRELTEHNIVAGPVWGRVRFMQGNMSGRVGNFTSAQQSAQEALNFFETALAKPAQNKHAFSTFIRRTLAGDPVNVGRVYALMGLIASHSGETYGQDPMAYFSKALALYEQHNSQREIGIVTCNIGDLYLRKGEYELAQSSIRNALKIAERVGDMSYVALNLANLGVSYLRVGNLIDAEKELASGISLSEHINERPNVSIMSTYLAIVLQEQGRLAEAVAPLFKALALSRAMHIPPYLGSALVAIANQRILQAIYGSAPAEGEEQQRVAKHGGKRVSKQAERAHLLQRARKTLERVLRLEGIEAETRTEARVTLAHTLLLLGDKAAAQQLAKQSLQEAQQFELTWLEGRAQRLLGNIAVAAGQKNMARVAFKEAVSIFEESDMRLDYGRTLHAYGMALLTWDKAGGETAQRGLTYLQAAHKIFNACKAQLDLQRIEDDIARYKPAPADAAPPKTAKPADGAQPKDDPPSKPKRAPKEVQ
jgi:DNA-binding SARP family transcriptional activator